MNIPRYNRFKVVLPTTMLPHWLSDLYTDILRDAGLAKVYPTGPYDCINESILGIDIPGIHMKLVEQNKRLVDGVGSVTTYWPIGLNNIRVLDDNSMALTFRHIDGFLNYQMLRDAVAYMADDYAQNAQGEVFKNIGDVRVITQLTDNYAVHYTYQQVVYDAIDGNKFAYAQAASENTFTVRCKFMYYYADYFYKGKCISHRAYNHKQGN